MKKWNILLIALLAMLAALAIIASCGDDDDDDDDSAPVEDDDDNDVDDDDTDDDDQDDDDDDDDDDTDDTWEGPPWFGCTEDDIPAEATVVTAFDQADHYFNPEDRRTIETQVDFPTSGDWSQVTMLVDLECPEDGYCDAWDRLANIVLVRNEGKEEDIIELWRYITPYDIGMCMLADVTEFAPLLSGTQTIRSFISTWVGPESSIIDGHGWRVTVKFIFHPASKADVPDQVINVWPYFSLEVGNPDNDISTQIGDKSLPLPATISKAELRLLVTGHGQGNRTNCAEFCHLDQVVMVNGTEFSFDPWRGDCSQNPIGPSQNGTWNFNRAGWCPGAPVIPHVFDVTAEVLAGQSNEFVYQVWEDDGVLYENTCRPGAGDAYNYCEGCQFDSEPGNCDYNGGFHTMPVDIISVMLFIWE